MPSDNGRRELVRELIRQSQELGGYDHPRPGLAFSDVVKELTAILGRNNVAVIGGVRRTGIVADWIDATRPAPVPEYEARLRLALRLARIIGTRFSESTVSAWFQGANPELDDELPIALVAVAPLDVVEKKLPLFGYLLFDCP